MERTSATSKDAFRSRLTQVSEDSRKNKSGTSSSGLVVVACDHDIQPQLPCGVEREHLEAKSKERDISAAETVTKPASVKVSPLATSEPDTYREGRCLLERFVGNSTPFNQKVIEVFVGCLNANELFTLGKKLNLNSVDLEVLTPESEQGKEVSIGIRTKKRGQQSDAQQAIATSLVHMCQSSPKKSLEIIDAVVEDKAKTYGVFTQGVEKSHDCQKIRDYCALPERSNLSVPPYSVMQAYTPLQISCQVGVNREERPATSVQVQAIARELSRIEGVQCISATGFQKQKSVPTSCVGYFPYVYVSLEKPSTKDQSTAKTDIVFSCRGDDLSGALDSAVSQNFDGSSQTKAVCQHLVNQESIHGLLGKVTSQMPLQMNTHAASVGNDYCLVRMIYLSPNRMAVICDQQFSCFAKGGGVGRPPKNKNSEGRLTFDITLLRSGDMWRVQDCRVDYADNVNSVKGVYNSESGMWEQGLSWLFGRGGVVKLSKPLNAQCVSGYRWLVSDELTKALRLRSGDISLYPPMNLWEEKIVEAEGFVSAGSLSLEAMQKIGSLYKPADVDSDCDLKRLCRQNPYEKSEEIAEALAHSLSIISQKREELTRRAESVGKTVFRLRQDFPPIDPSLFEQDDETQQKLSRLTELYESSTAWHKEKLSNLIDIAQADLKEKADEDLSALLKEVKAFEKVSVDFLASYRTGDSEGGQITKHLKVKDTSDPKQKVRSENLAPHISLSYIYSAGFVWYRKKVQHQIEQEIKRREMTPWDTEKKTLV